MSDVICRGLLLIALKRRAESAESRLCGHTCLKGFVLWTDWTSKFVKPYGFTMHVAGKQQSPFDYCSVTKTTDMKFAQTLAVLSETWQEKLAQPGQYGI